MFKRFLSALLVCVLVLGMVPVVAGAEEADTGADAAAWSSTVELIPATVDLTEEEAAAVIEAMDPNHIATRDVGDNSFYENESNNSMDLADMLYSDYTVSGTIYGYDMDWFAFQLNYASVVNILTLSDNSSLIMGIFDSTGEVCLVAGSSFYDDGYYYDYIDHYLVPGVYYLCILDGSALAYTSSYMFYYVAYTADSSITHTHSYTEDSLIISDSTCTVNGVRLDYCNCGATKTVSLPLGAHTYSGGYCVVCGIEEPPFPDVAHDAYYYDAVKWAVANGITAGYGSGEYFKPDLNCTRAQVVTFLWRAAGSPAPNSTYNPFVDVSSDAWYYTAVLWAVEEGITAGYGAGGTQFKPDLDCTRSQVVSFLHRAAGSPAPASSVNPFTDVSPSAWYYADVLWAVEEGITAGYGAGGTQFRPDLVCSRGQIVTFLYRAYN